MTLERRGCAKKYLTKSSVRVAGNLRQEEMLTGAIGEGAGIPTSLAFPRLPCLESLIRLQQRPGLISTDQENHYPATVWFLQESWGRSRGHVLSGRPGRPCSLGIRPHWHLQTTGRCKGTAILVFPPPYRLSGQPDGKTWRLASVAIGCSLHQPGLCMASCLWS